jgi:hypothetical protein
MQTFVNLPVKGLTRSTEFFSKLGFSFDPQFTDENLLQGRGSHGRASSAAGDLSCPIHVRGPTREEPAHPRALRVGDVRVGKTERSGVWEGRSRCLAVDVS